MVDVVILPQCPPADYPIEKPRGIIQPAFLLACPAKSRSGVDPRPVQVLWGKFLVHRVEECSQYSAKLDWIFAVAGFVYL
jgi:hypothetical protein